MAASVGNVFTITPGTGDDAGKIDINFTVTFSPDEVANDQMATITFTGGGAEDANVGLLTALDTNPNNVYTLTGDGIGLPVLTADADQPEEIAQVNDGMGTKSFDFGDVAINTTRDFTYTLEGSHLTAPVVVTITGSTDFTISENNPEDRTGEVVITNGAHTGDTFTITPGTGDDAGEIDIEFTVAFSPTMNADIQMATITTTGGGVSPTIDDYMLTGNPVMPELTVTDPTDEALTTAKVTGPVPDFDFGDVIIGETPRTFTYTLEGGDLLSDVVVTLAGPGFSSYSITADGVIPATTSTKKTLTFTPGNDKSLSATVITVTFDPMGRRSQRCKHHYHRRCYIR